MIETIFNKLKPYLTVVKIAFRKWVVKRHLKNWLPEWTCLKTRSARSIEDCEEEPYLAWKQPIEDDE